MKCDICGATESLSGRPFDTNQQLSMHKFRGHGVKSPTSPKKKPLRKSLPAAKPNPRPLRFDVVLRERFSENGRILLTDQDGEWWVARKLDV